MADTSAASSTSGSVLDSLSIDRYKKSSTSTGDKALGEDAFLKLMVAQLNHQDPLAPKDNGEFISQLAQFSSVEGITKLNTKLGDMSTSFANSLDVQNSTLKGIDKLNSGITGLSNSYVSNQALQASALVGHSVTVDTNQTQFMQGDIVNGIISLPSYAADVNLHIIDTETGQRVDTVPLGALQGGDNVFRWNGKQFELNGQVVNFNSQITDVAANGRYQFVAAADINGVTQNAGMSLSANVNSVTLGGDGKLVLNLAGLGAVPFTSIKQVS